MRKLLFIVILLLGLSVPVVSYAATPPSTQKTYYTADDCKNDSKIYIFYEIYNTGTLSWDKRVLMWQEDTAYNHNVQALLGYVRLSPAIAFKYADINFSPIAMGNNGWFKDLPWNSTGNGYLNSNWTAAASYLKVQGDKDFTATQADTTKAYISETNIPIMTTSSGMLGNTGQLVNADEYVKITQPFDHYRTVDKVISVTASYKVHTTDASKVHLQWLSNGLPFASNSNIQGWQVWDNVFTTDTYSGYSQGYIQIHIQYKGDSTEFVSLQVTDDQTAKTVEDMITFTLKSFIDSNGDGKDDESGETPYVKPASDYYPDMPPGQAAIPTVPTGISDIQGVIDGVLNTLTGSFGWIATFGTFVGMIFGWLPPEILSLLYIAIAASVISFVIRVFRGS